MEEIIKITLTGLFAGVIGTSLGGIIGVILTSLWDKFKFIKKYRKNSKELIYSSLLEFSSGLMIAVVCFDLLPEAFLLSGVINSVLGILLGLILMVLLQNVIAKTTHKASKKNHSMLMTGVLVITGIAIHNLPEGIAIGSSFLVDKRLAFSVTIAIALHNMPEGMVSAIPFKASGVNSIKSIIYTALAGIPMGIGAFLGSVAGNVSNNFVAVCLSFAGGAMLYICVCDLIRESKETYRGRIPSICNIMGIIFGIFLSKAL